MRLSLLIFGGVAVVVVALLLLAPPHPATAPAPPPVPAASSSAGGPASARTNPKVARAQAAAAAAAHVREVKLPRTIAEATRAFPGLEREMMRLTPDFRMHLKSRLLLVPLVADCVAGRVKRGKIGVALHYKLSADDRHYEADKVAFDDDIEGLTDDDKALVLRCVAETFRDVIPVEDGQMLSPASEQHIMFAFPSEEDTVYLYASMLANRELPPTADNGFPGDD
jgi:hypothetical protein